MNGGFHRCRHKESPDQYIGLQSINADYWCLICKTQHFPRVLEDFLNVSIVGDLHIVEFQPCASDFHVITSLQLSGAGR